MDHNDLSVKGKKMNTVTKNKVLYYEINNKVIISKEYI